MESEEIVLTYKSATLRKKDISFLNDGNWLNDQVINFYYEYLASNLSVDATDEDKRIVLMDPASVGLMLYTEDLEDLFDIFQPLELDHAGIIFCPINDNKNKFKQSGGNHWALVVYLRCTDKFYYFDSGSGFISHVPKIIAKLRCLILNDMDIKHLLAEADEIVEMPNAPKQTNSFDCGVYVLAITNEILNIYIEDNGWVGMNFENNHLRIYNMIDIDFEENVNPTSIKELRKEIKDIIKSMIKK